MPIIDEKRIVGNYGTNLVAHVLSNICLVRPVAEGTDIGVDLYCETVEDRQGFLHFWAQVKSGAQIRIKKTGKASCKFMGQHLDYWDRQPVPVFSFYVQSSFPPKTPAHIFGTDLSAYLMTIRKPIAKYKVIESQFKINLEGDDWQKPFISRLKTTSALLRLRDDGIVSRIPEMQPNYVMRYPSPIGVSGYAEMSLRTIRTTVSSLVADAALLKYHRSQEPRMNYYEPLVKILRIFERGKRPEIMRASSLWAAIIEKNTKKAKKMIATAIKSINNDPNLDETMRTAWRKEFDPLRQIINDLEIVKKH